MNTPSWFTRSPSSPLVQHGGVRKIGRLDAGWLSRIQSEAEQRSHLAAPSRFSGGNRDAGEPDRNLETVACGPELMALMHDAGFERELEGWTGSRWMPLGSLASYSYYRRPGHYLGHHRDIEGCELTCIICVFDRRPPNSRGSGTLIAYPSLAKQRCSNLVATPTRGARAIPVEEGDLVLIYGRYIPHCVTPVHEGHVRVVAPVCFARCGPDAPGTRRSRAEGGALRLAGFERGASLFPDHVDDADAQGTAGVRHPFSSAPTRFTQ